MIDWLNYWNRIYEHIYGNCEKKELDFQHVVEKQFGHKKLVELLTMLHENDITTANGKLVMMQIIDGDERSPKEIAQDLGLTATVTINQEVQDAVAQVIEENPSIV